MIGLIWWIFNFISKNSALIWRKEGTWLDRKINGTFKCGSCKACPFVCRSKVFVSVNTGKSFTMRDFANCCTKGLVYLCKCSCPMEYIGKTIRELRRRILDHAGDICNRRDTPIARHVWEVHGGDEKVLQFYVIKVIRESPVEVI